MQKELIILVNNIINLLTVATKILLYIMIKAKFKFLLDFVPLIIITIYAMLLIWKRLNGEILFQWKHLVGLLFLAINYFMFFWRHKIGVLSLGLTLLLGLLSLLSFSPAITTTTLYKGSGETGIPIFYGQLIFLLWLLIHFIVSGRHYVGIATKKYWMALGKNSEVTFD